MSKPKLYLSHAVLILASFLSVFPLYYMICGATNPSIDVVRGKLIPGTYLIENFKNLIANQNLGLAMTNSFRNSILLTLLTLLICSIAGYGFEIYHDKGKDILMSITVNRAIVLAKWLPPSGRGSAKMHYSGIMMSLIQGSTKTVWLMMQILAMGLCTSTTIAG